MFSEMDYWASIDRARERALGKTVRKAPKQPKHRAGRKVRIELPMSVEAKRKETKQKVSVEDRRAKDRARWHKRMADPIFAAKERLRQRLKHKRRKDAKDNQTKSA